MQIFETRAARGGCGEVRTRLAGWSLALAIILAPCLAGAQGMFYREVVKDGRIYVFNIMKSYDQFEKSGEMGVGITRIGFGPNGETVVFDSEEAINAYLFKQGKPGEVFVKTPVKTPKMSVTWKDGKTTIETDLFKLNLSNRVQVRYTLIDLEAEDTDTIGSFRIRRAKTKFDGWFYNSKMEFELQLNWPAADILEDANFNIILGKDRSLMVKAGSFKVPFGRQELTSSGSQQFVDRTAVSNFFALGRDLGVQVWGELLNHKLEYRAGIFNGAGFGRVNVNENDKYQYVGRLQFHGNGDPKYSESDFESTDKALYAIAAQFDINDQRPGPSNALFKREHFGFDGVFKYKGISVFGEYFLGTRTNVDEEEADDSGFNLQAGYQIVRNKFEIAGRYSVLDLNTDSDDDSREEIGGAFSYYYNKHNLKWQTDIRQLKNNGADEGSQKVIEFRTQLQFIF